jgi:hypothetical protein
LGAFGTESNFNHLVIAPLEMNEATIREFLSDLHKRRYAVDFQVNLHQEAVVLLM